MNENKNDEGDGSARKNTLLLIKVGLLMVFLLGVLMRIFIPIRNFDRLADVLMASAALARLFMYAKSLQPSLFLPKQNNSSTLSLIEKRDTFVPTYDQRTLTPLERVISDK